MPDKTPLKPVIHGRVEREGFTVEKVYFESLPNHFVTGLLFRPKDKMGKLPAVLCPHGHGGRLQDYGAGRMKQLIETGAEKFEDCGRYPKLSRCVQLARMGCVTFIFDMIGYADSVQITRQHAHGFSKQRPNFEGKDSWGLFSTQAELRLQSIMGLQTWNSIRALDFLCSLPDVDPKRVGVTGGSGGGTQTILLGAIDPRPVVTFPQGMVSTAMQGGCTCENCCLLRVGTGNVELTALFAPKPQAMTSANDWTKEMMTKGYPELKKLYKLLGAEDDVMCTAQLHFPHNYNYVTRRLMCNWFNKYLKLGLKEPVVEERWKPLTAEEWTVWNDEHPRPKGGEDYERALTKYMAKQSDRQIAALMPKDEDTLAEFKKVVGGAFDTMIGRSWDEVGRIDRKKVDKQDHGSYLYFEDLVRTEKHGEELPMISFFPKTVDWNEQVVIWIDGYGKAGLLDDNGRAIPQIQRLLDAGTAVLSADLFLQGEFIESGKPAEENRVVSNPREYAGYTFGYNQTLFASRAHDILTLIKFVHGDEHQPKQIHLVGVNGAGPWVAAARAQAGAVINRAAIDTFGFRFADLTTYKDINFLPGAVKYGDLPALLALSAPNNLFIAGEFPNCYVILGMDSEIVAAALEEAQLRFIVPQNGVVGVGLGLTLDGRAAIKVLVVDAGVAGIPETVQGVPVIVQVTGEIVAQSAPIGT
ncbi:MAG: acetylxylan esterase, partial [Planctomycetes bacterium]|nr:acetylxylan esterase [Planctomycetota bacterium]